MAVGVVVERGGWEYNGRMTSFVVLSCMMAAMGGVIFGYDTGISGGVTSMESFLKKFFPEVYTKMKEDTKISNYCKFDSQLLTSFTSSPLHCRPHRLLLRLLGHQSLRAQASVPLYLSEMAPARYRGAINNGFQFSIGIGSLIANLINYGTEKIKGGWGWRISLGMAALPASILTLGAIFLPETPNSLIERSNHHHKAKSMLQKVRGTEDVQEELEDLIKASDISKTTTNQFRKNLSEKI
ncbi:major facilitator superfamily protein [Actinidia rufa]|uniref:Major facilitator superfamily protein n=1 Tax=Actinidia rufa TaxID=165716 RepID=A0A7J0ED46_9ERIC|nr:major facilitator superfamily protein [Actinidia rufa]